jgi:hypothetical protein
VGDGPVATVDEEETRGIGWDMGYGDFGDTQIYPKHDLSLVLKVLYSCSYRYTITTVRVR